MSTKNNKMTTKNGLATKTITKYYFIVKSTQNTWVPILSPFVMSSPNSTAGEFLSSSWYKNAIPEEYECAVIRITIDATDEKKRVVADAMRILDCVAKMNDAEDDTIGELDFVIMHHVMKKKYLLSIHRRLRKLLENNNSDTATTHATMQTATGTFGMSFAIKKHEDPHMYCPAFELV
jgi:hypothetical protein